MENLVDHSLFNQLAIILVLASAIGFVSVRLKQPLIIAFIITGLLVSPSVFNIVSEGQESLIETLAQFGIALLLFMVGLKLDLRIIKKTGPIALFIGTLQVSLCAAFGFGLGFVFGLGVVESAMIGLALAFSSTIVAVKLLSDRRAIDSLYGRIALGILIIQDLLVILTTIVITALTSNAEAEAWDINSFIQMILKSGGLFVFMAVFIRFLAGPTTSMLARNGELMVIFSIAFAVFMAALCEHLHFSRELGGLLAGVALASTPYNNVIVARLSALRDFLLLFFFAHLGSQIDLNGIEELLLPAVALSVFVLIGKSFLIMGIMHIFHFTSRIGFLTGISLSQISEFSLIVMSMGYGAAIVSMDTLNLITLVALITMAMSTYAIAYGDALYSMLEKLFSWKPNTGNPKWKEEEYKNIPKSSDIIIFGVGRYGSAMAKLFMKKGYSILAIDFAPDTVKAAKEKGVPTIYGDAADPDFLNHLPLDKAKVIVFSFHHYMVGPLMTDLRRTLAKVLREEGYTGHIATTSHRPEHDQDLPEHGIDIILNPFDDAAFYGTEEIVDILSKEKKGSKKGAKKSTKKASKKKK